MVNECADLDFSSLISETLRALYLGDNDFEVLSPDINNLKNLQIVSEIQNLWYIHM